MSPIIRVFLICTQVMINRRSWDWLKPGKVRSYPISSQGYAEIKWNADGDNRIFTRKLDIFYTPQNQDCANVNSWHFGNAQGTHEIHLFPGMF